MPKTIITAVFSGDDAFFAFGVYGLADLLWHISPIQPCYGQLQHCRERNPYNIRDIGKGDPLGIRPNSHQRPNERAKHQYNIYRSQQIVLEPKLYRRKDKVKRKIERKR